MKYVKPRSTVSFLQSMILKRSRIFSYLSYSFRGCLPRILKAEFFSHFASCHFLEKWRPVHSLQLCGPDLSCPFGFCTLSQDGSCRATILTEPTPFSERWPSHRQTFFTFFPEITQKVPSFFILKERMLSASNQNCHASSERQINLVFALYRTVGLGFCHLWQFYQ